jgi:hypothetical protein
MWVQACDVAFKIFVKIDLDEFSLVGGDGRRRRRTAQRDKASPRKDLEQALDEPILAQRDLQSVLAGMLGDDEDGRRVGRSHLDLDARLSEPLKVCLAYGGAGGRLYGVGGLPG